MSLASPGLAHRELGKRGGQRAFLTPGTGPGCLSSESPFLLGPHCLWSTRVNLPARKVGSTTVQLAANSKQSKHPSQRNEHRHTTQCVCIQRNGRQQREWMDCGQPLSTKQMHLTHMMWGARMTEARTERESMHIKLKQAKPSRCGEGCIERWCKHTEKQGRAVSESGAAG